MEPTESEDWAEAEGLKEAVAEAIAPVGTVCGILPSDMEGMRQILSKSDKALSGRVMAALRGYQKGARQQANSLSHEVTKLQRALERSQARVVAAKSKPKEEELHCDVEGVLVAMKEIDAKENLTPKERAKQKAETVIAAVDPRVFLMGLTSKLQQGDAKVLALYLTVLGLMTKEQQVSDETPLAPIFNLTVLAPPAPEPEPVKKFDGKPVLTLSE